MRREKWGLCMTSNTAGTRQGDRGATRAAKWQPLNPEWGWKMPAAPSWDSFSIGAKSSKRGKIREVWRGNVDSAETGQEISVAALIFPWFMLKTNPQHLNVWFILLLGEKKAKAPLQGIDSPDTPKSLQTQQSWELLVKFTVPGIHWLKKLQNLKRTPQTWGKNNTNPKQWCFNSSEIETETTTGGKRGPSHPAATFCTRQMLCPKGLEQTQQELQV